MTPLETLDRAYLELLSKLEGETVELTVPTARSLIADSRALRELVEALPKCMGDDPCESVATLVWRFGDGSVDEFYCDRHGPLWQLELGSKAEISTAAITRRLGL